MKASIDDEPQPTIGTIPKVDERLDVVEQMIDPTAWNGFSMAVQYEDVTVGKSVAIKLLCLQLLVCLETCMRLDTNILQDPIIQFYKSRQIPNYMENSK